MTWDMDRLPGAVVEVGAGEAAPQVFVGLYCHPLAAQVHIATARAHQCRGFFIRAK